MENNKIPENIKIKHYNSKNESENNFSDMETLEKRKIRRTKEKVIKCNIKRNNKISDKQVNKNDKNNTKKTKNYRKRKRKKYQSNEERKMKDRIPTLNKSIFFLRGKQIQMKMKVAREKELIILIC